MPLKISGAVKKTFSIFAFSLLLFAVAAAALAINSNTHLGMSLSSVAPSVTSASPSINSTITPWGRLTNQQTILSTTTPIVNGIVELWDVIANKSITIANTNSEGKYQAVLKIVCNNTFKMETRFTGTSDYLPETSNQITVTPTGGSACLAGQDPYQVVSTAPPTATGSSGSASKDYKPLVPIPGFTTTTDTTITGYLSRIYNFLISIVGILAMAVIIYGGMKYMVSAGNPTAMEDAKEVIWSAVYGLALALGSWLIINVVNPDILVLKNPGVEWPSGKYSYNDPPTERACVADTNLEGIPVLNDATKEKCNCVDDPTREVTFTPSVVTGPYVVKPSINPCAINVPLTTTSFTIKFSEAIDSTTITTSTIIVSPAIPPITSVVLTSSDTATVTFTGSLPVMPGTDYLVTVTTGVKSASGVPMENPYAFRFTANSVYVYLDPCTPPVPTVTTCLVACSNPSTPNLTPPGYHCLKADLRVGTTMNPPSGSKNIMAKVNQTIYFDVKSGSADYAYPGLKIDVSATDLAFKNGIERYVLKWTNWTTPYVDTPAGNTIKTFGFTTNDYVGDEGGACTWVGWVANLIGELFGSVRGIGSFSFGAQGTYKVGLNVYNKNGCLGPAIDIGYVIVGP